MVQPVRGERQTFANRPVEAQSMRPNELKIASTYQIGQLCQHFSISPRALRFYEEKGLIAPRRGAHKTRQYSRADFNRVQVISWGRRAALSLEEIRELLDDYDRADSGRRQLGTALENHLMIAEALIGGLHSAAGRIERQGDQARAEINRLMRDLDGSEIADVELQDAVRNGAVSLMLTYL